MQSCVTRKLPSSNVRSATNIHRDVLKTASILRNFKKATYGIFFNKKIYLFSFVVLRIITQLLVESSSKNVKYRV